MISHELKKCTQVHSVLVGVTFTGSIHYDHHRRRCLKKYWLVRKCKCVIKNAVPLKTSTATQLRPEKQKRKSPRLYWNPQMSVRQETWLIPTLGSFSQSSVRKHTRTKTVRVKRDNNIGGVYNTVRANGCTYFHIESCVMSATGAVRSNTHASY